MYNGIVIMPISGDQKQRDLIFESLTKNLNNRIVYVGVKDTLNVNGNDFLKADIIISNLKTHLSHNKSFIWFDCENRTNQQRQIVFDIVLKANYKPICLVLDTPQNFHTMVEDSQLLKSFVDTFFKT